MHFDWLALYTLNSCLAVTYCITVFAGMLFLHHFKACSLSLTLNIAVHWHLSIAMKWATLYSCTSKSCLVTMWQASSHGSFNRVSTNINTPTVTSRAITLHFIIAAICRTLWYKASNNRVFWFFIQWVGTKGFKSLFLALGKACSRLESLLLHEINLTLKS